MAELAERHGMRDMQFSLAFDEVAQSLNGGELARAERALLRAEALVEATSLLELMLLDVTRMRVALLKGQIDDALFRAARARRYAVELQCPGPMLGVRELRGVRMTLRAGARAGLVSFRAEHRRSLSFRAEPRSGGGEESHSSR